MGWLRHLVLHNWWLKLLALGLAFALWAWVIPNESRPEERDLSVPLMIANLPPGLEVVGDVPPRIHLHVRGSGSRVRRLTPEELGVVLDLGGVRAGNHGFRLTAANVRVPPGVEVVRLVPEELRLQVVRR